MRFTSRQDRSEPLRRNKENTQVYFARDLTKERLLQDAVAGPTLRELKEEGYLLRWIPFQVSRIEEAKQRGSEIIVLRDGREVHLLSIHGEQILVKLLKR